VRDPDRTDEELEELLAEGDKALAEGDHAAVRERVRRMRALGGKRNGRARYLEAMLAWETDGAEAAVAGLSEAAATDPDDADIRHALGLACEEVGDREGMQRHFLVTRQLDAEADRRSGIGRPEELDLIERTAREAIEGLPAELRARLRNVTVVLQKRPSLALVREGFDPRAYGLFDVPPLVDGAAPFEEPSQIVLYTSNLLGDFADPDEIAAQTEVTVLHEIAHYFGFEEDEMERLGLS
jgi:predicted Zn-dependent protease with MMP-like domain